METDTTSLRKAAPQWSLAGDKQLLGMLEKIHQTIVSKCQDTNSKLDAMVDALDNASVDLQNVNNKFMALSNSQFVESRVYDDDVDVAIENVTKQEQPKLPTNEEKAEIINKALQKLELMHEPLEILDSDSSDDEESSMILKPKDIYSHRPLPYIIGSFAWKNKWHAGLVQEESDSDSSISKHEEAEEYSESEPETIDVQPTNQHTISSSSSLQSEISKEPQVIQQKPADIAAEISRRLGGPPLMAPIPHTVPIEVPEPSKTVYRIEKPAPTIFPDEPPPLDNVESEYSDDDIFAELHKKPHQNRPNEYKSDIMQDLFGNSVKDGIVSHIPVENKPNSTLPENSPLLDDSVQSKLAPGPTKEVTPDNEIHSKKPVGGISLFGSNKGTESIGADILKRNQRKISNSEEENDIIEDNEPEKGTDKIKQPNSKKIIEDLFVKPVKKVDKSIRFKQPNVKLVHNEPAPAQKTNKPTDKIDLFSDNIFDDIDDIFTTNVIKPKIDKNAKSIFDDDDLFSEIVKNPEKSSKKDIKGIFDNDDDDLFTENDSQPKASATVIKTSTDKNKKDNEEAKIVKSIFDDDSDDDLFSDIKDFKAKPKIEDHSIETKSSLNVNSKSVISQNSEKTNIKENNDILFRNNDIESDILNVSTDKKTQSEQFLSPNLFDAEDDELFNTSKQNNEKIRETENTTNSRDNNNGLSNESKENNDIGDNFDNENEFNEPPSFETRNLDKNKQNENPDNMSFKDDIFNPTPIRVNNEKTEPNVSIERDKQSKEKDIFQNDMLKNEPTAEILTNISVSESKKSETKPDEDPFSDIFTDLPPAFEKPSEPKKSKNVNALFDDDSDDESLFFKKDDVVSDEKPDINFDSDRFRIFHDEPPDIDVDFSQKTLKVSNDKNYIFNNNKEQNEDKPVEYILPQNLDVMCNDTKNNIKCNDNAKILEELKNQEIDIPKLLEKVKAGEQNNENDNLKNKVSQIETETHKKDLQTNEEIIDSSEEIETKKPIGKLKPMGFNINVNTLLPGASPKKSKINEETDGQSTSTHSNEELNISSPIKDVTMVKSVSFGGDPDAGVLDNKLSKERAKIQVKRRPSTRRARLEAVRKSRVDLESDSTDNSSSFDEPRKVKHDTLKKNKSDDINLEKDKSKKNIDFETNLTDIEVKSDTIPKKNENAAKKPEVKSKVVYVLNDEDIFSTPTKTDVNKQNPNLNVLSIVDDDDDELFKTTNTKTQSKEEKSNEIEVNSNITAKNTEKNKKTNVNKSNKSIFGDSDDDEELFGKKKINKDKKASIFDSDTDDDVKLFTNKKKIEKKEIKKGPLFDDESDDGDLFGGKTKKRQTSEREMKKSNQEIVFEHPLSYKGNIR